MMGVSIKLFAAAREAVGASEIDVALPRGATIGDLRRALVAQRPALARLVEHAMFAVDAEYANDDVVIDEASEVACIPPVSGG